MRLQFGCFHRGRRIVWPSEFSIGNDYAGSCSSEISDDFHESSILMGFRGHRLTWEEDAETQPYQEGTFVLTFDGRLDNREEIAFQAGTRVSRSVPDPVIIIRAYEKYGDVLLEKLIGEFALTIWNRNTRSLTFARSVDGARPLYYMLEKDKLMWASSLKVLLINAASEPRINENYILEFLSSVPRSRHTPFATVGTVPPGTVFHFENDALGTPKPLWKPPEPDEPLRSDAEYEEEFRDKITESVRVRLRAKQVVFSELSGGLDSTSIVLLGDRVLSSPDTLQTVSCVYENSKTCDETHFIKLVEQFRAMQGNYVHEEEQGVTLALQDMTFTGIPNPLRLHAGRYLTYIRHMRRYGAKILLTGVGGDDLFGCNPDATPFLADDLFHGHLHRMHQHCKQWSRLSGRPYFRLLFRQALPFLLGPILPRAVQYQPMEFPDFLTESCKEKIKTDIETTQNSEELRITPSRRVQLRSVQMLFDLLGAGHFADFPDIYISHPYSHRPLVELCLRAPLSQFIRAGQFRSLMRRALKDVLPSKILERKTKTSMDETILRAVQREWDQIGDLRQWEVTRREYVDAAQLQALLLKSRIGIQSQVGSLVNIFALEQWFRSLRAFNNYRSSMQAKISDQPVRVHAFGGSTHANSWSQSGRKE